MTTFTTSSTRYTKRAARHRRGGFTVLEVLIALVVLLIGGLAILNVFPPALNVIRGSENREVAMAQAKGTLAKFNSDPATIPDAVYNASNTGLWQDARDANGRAIGVEGSRTRNSSLPKTAVVDSMSALGSFKRVVREHHKVLQYTDATNVIHNFVLLNYAYAYDPATPANNPINVWSVDPIEGAQVNNTGAVNSSEITVSSSGNQPMALPGAPSRYYVSYSWISSTGYLQSVLDEPFLASGTANSGNVSNPNVVSGPVSITMLTALGAVPSSDDSFRGYLGVTGVLPGQEVAVDYAARDWRWLIEEASANVPNALVAGSRDVKLTVPELSTTIAPSLYGLVYKAPANNDSGIPVPGTWSGTTPSGSISGVNRTAVVYNVGAIPSPRVRTSYQATHGWAQQLSVAARSYYPANTGAFSEQWREYAWLPNNSTISFRPSEAGKTVLVSFSYLDTGVLKTVNDQVVTISAKPKPSAVLAGSIEVAEATLLDPKSTSGATAPDVVAITSVRGASVRARSAWIQNGNYTQEVAEMYRPLN